MQILLTVGGELCVSNAFAKRLGVVLKQLINRVRFKKNSACGCGGEFLIVVKLKLSIVFSIGVAERCWKLFISLWNDEELKLIG